MDQDMLSDFYIEADELYAEAEDALLDFEKSDDFDTHFNSIFRAFHSVKGAAGMFGLTKLQEHMHFLENLLDKKKVDGTLSNIFVDYLLSGVDSAKKITAGEDVEFQYFDPDVSEALTEVVGGEAQEVAVNKELVSIIKQGVIKRKNHSRIQGNIFVVDDEIDILQITKDYLEMEEYQVTIFSKAHDAIEALKDIVPDAIITDINMPEMNGIQFMQVVNKLIPHLPIIVASGYVTKDVCLESLACGVAGILEKPYEVDVFINIVSLAVEKYRAFKLLNKSLDLIVYQFEDFDKFLAESGMESKRKVLREELKTILKQKKILVERVR